MSAQLLSVIEVKTSRGNGTEENPIRIVYQYWTHEGFFVAERDTNEPPPTNAGETLR